MSTQKKHHRAQRTRHWQLDLTTLAMSAALAICLRAASAGAGPIVAIDTPTPSIDPRAFGIQVDLPFKSTSQSRAPGLPRLAAPGLLSTIEGFDFDDNSTEAGSRFIPPDPIGAAGPAHLVAVVNVMIEWYDKTGGSPFRDALKDFFAPVSPVNSTFDPKVIYDQHDNRFVVVTLEVTLPDSAECASTGGVGTSGTSRILVAVSKDSDPNNGFWFHAINSKMVIGGLDHWADYPGLAVDKDAVFITNNMFPMCTSGYGGSRLWIVHKDAGSGGFYDGGAATVTTHDPYAAAGGAATTTQPAHVFGTVPGSSGTFLVSYSGLTDGTSEYVQNIRVSDPVGTPSFSQEFILCCDIEDFATGMPDAPQAACSLAADELPIVPVRTNDRRALHSVWRENSLWMTATIVPPTGGPDGGEATAYWWEIDTSPGIGSDTITQHGSIGAEDLASGTYTSFASVAVNACGDAAFGFAASASTIFPSACYTGREAGDAAGTVQSTGVLASGLDCYRRTFGTPRNRWGDYSGIAIDPNDDRTFWVFNEYAITRGSPTGPAGSREYGRWGTRWGSFQFDCPPVEVTLSGFGAERMDGGAVLEWRVASAYNHDGFHVYREPEGAKREFIGEVRTNGRSTLRFTDPAAPVGRVSYWLREVEAGGELGAWYGPTLLDAAAMILSLTGQPNPFHGEARLHYSLPRAGQVQLVVYDARGRLVSTVIDDFKTAGNHLAQWDGRLASGARASSGLYVLQLKTGGQVLQQKVVLAR